MFGKKNIFFCYFISVRSAETTSKNISFQKFKSFLKPLESKLGVCLHQIILMTPPVVQLQWLPTHLTAPFAPDLPRAKFEVALTFWLPQSTVLQLPITCPGNLTAKEGTSHNASCFVNYLVGPPSCHRNTITAQPCLFSSQRWIWCECSSKDWKNSTFSTNQFRSDNDNVVKMQNLK